MPAFLPVNDESAMNFEGLGVSFREIYRFPKHFTILAELGEGITQLQYFLQLSLRTSEKAQKTKFTTP